MKRAVAMSILLVACSGPPASEPPPRTTSTPPSTTSTPPSSQATPPPPSTPAGPTRVELLEDYEDCHATLRDQRDARSRDHRHVARITAERDAARTAVDHAHGAELTSARAVLSDLEEDLREAHARYDAERASVRVSEDACNRLLDQIRAMPR